MNNELYPKAISDILGNTFFIPEYQRGYRWTKRQVVNMLDDIYEFYLDSRNKEPSVFYCLQPIVVKKKEEEWELIDGQQRLTTLHLILTYLKDLVAIFGKDKLHLKYATRENGSSFLENIDKNRRNENIDFFHICNAYEAIEEWFNEKDGALKPSILQTIISPDDIGKNVKVIWYEVREHVDPVDIFTRLNIGKIPLTNAELVKALFLRKENLSSRNTTILQLKIAQEWDIIEKKLHNDAFWYFISNANNYATRIEYVLELMANELYQYLQSCATSTTGSPNSNNPNRLTSAIADLIKNRDGIDYSITLEDDDPYRIFFIFNKIFELTGKNAARLWAEIKKYFMTFEEWYEDRYFFHIIGFLIKTGTTPTTIMDFANSSDTKEEFRLKLREAILTNSLKLKTENDVTHEDIAEHIDSLSYDTSENSRFKIRSVLLLFNVLSLIDDQTSNLRFQFDAYCQQAEHGGWDIEHIHSVASGKPGRIDDKKQWLDHVFRYLEGDSHQNSDNRYEELANSIKTILTSTPFDSNSEFDNIYDTIIRTFGDGEEESVDNSIANLTLLDSATNRSYKNAIFPIKREKIIELDKKATFVPSCTRNVFLKYYSKRPDKMFKWERTDREAYKSAMTTAISHFLMTGREGHNAEPKQR